MRRSPTRKLALPFLLAAAALAAGAGTDDPTYSALNGAHTYKTYCANCHGVEGRGDGYLAKTLRARPTDLTRLAERSGGKFPAERIWAAIDGRVEVEAHGRREMPVWGDVFLWPEGDTPAKRAQVERKIGELVEHLKTLQRPAAPGG
jgi:mono/diheme cytochrome c family protein